MNDRLIEINNSISNSIHRHDEKATSLFTATGIIFGLSSFLTASFLTKTNQIQLVFIYVFIGLYLLTFLLLVILFAMTIFPRRKTKEEKSRNLPFQHYSEDVYLKMKDYDFILFLSNECDKNAIVDQIKINSRIAHKKENLIIASVITTIVFSMLLVSLVVLSLI